MHIKRSYLLTFLFALSFTWGAFANSQSQAQDKPIVLSPEQASARNAKGSDGNAPTHDAIKMTPDKSELIKLDRPAAAVFVGNPNHVTILPDSTQTIVLVAQAPGATYFTALDDVGDVIMSRHVIVASPKQKYVRVRTSCAVAENDDCQTTQVYYCPDMCHQILMNIDEKASGESDKGKEASESTEQATDALSTGASPPE